MHWCGAQLQAPHRAVREVGWQPEHSGVFISRWHHGSPAHRYGLFALHWILEVGALAASAEAVAGVGVGGDVLGSWWSLLLVLPVVPRGPAAWQP